MSVHDFLKERGYKGPVEDSFKDQTVYFYRKVPDTTHQWVVYDHSLTYKNTDHHGYSIEMTYETYDGIWANTKFYGLTEEQLRDKIEELEHGLYESVSIMGGNREDYQGGSEE
jgi:hypothetical protein